MTTTLRVGSLRTVRQIVGWLDARSFGASVSLPDNAAPIQAAIDAAHASGGGTVLLPSEPDLVSSVYTSGQIVLKDRVTLTAGSGIDAVTLRAKNALNTHFIVASDCVRPGLRDITIDGNRANQSSGDAVRLECIGHQIQNVKIINAKHNGLMMTAPDAVSWYPNQHGTISRVEIIGAGRNGLEYQGPSDGNGDYIVVIDASQEADNTYDGIVVGNGRWRNLHAWGRLHQGGNPLPPAHRYALHVTDFAVDISDSQFSGGKTAQMYVSPTAHHPKIAGVRFYNPYFEGYDKHVLDYNVIIESQYGGHLTDFEIQGVFDNEDEKGIDFGTVAHPAKGWRVSGIISNTPGGAIDLTHSGGHNLLDIRGFYAGDPPNIGSFHASDIGSILIHEPVGYAGTAHRIVQLS